MSRRFLVSDGSNANDVLTYKVAQAGVVKPILTAYVAAGGVVRQYWPFAGETPSRLEWNTDAISITHIVTDPANAVASIIFNRDLGTYTYKNHPDADVTETYINPPLIPTTDDGTFLIKVDQTSSSGDVITGTLGSWIDLNQASLTWSLDKGVVGTAGETANITIAEDDGGGSPVSGTEIVKVATFVAEVITSGSNIVWTDEQRDLVELKEAEDADCDLTFNPNGLAIGDADTSGAFSEKWHIDYPGTVANPVNYTVQVDLISGDTPTGTLGSTLTLDAVRTWKLLAVSGEDKSCALDVTVDDTVINVTKRVTMNSVRTAPVVQPPVWTTTQWDLTDILWPQALALLAQMTISIFADGTATGQMGNVAGGPTEQENEDWHTGAPTPSDAENYEVMFVGSNGVSSGPTTDVWHTIDVNRVWVVEFPTLPADRDYHHTVRVRAIGGVSVDKLIVMTVIADSGGTPP